MTTATTAAPTSAPAKSARERLLDAADELFYREGVHTVGIDRIIDRAGVAKASLYNTFGSKDDLVEAYLRRRHESITARLTQGLQRYRTPRTRLLGVFEVQSEIVNAPDYSGCAFANATAETHGPGAERAIADYRLWVRTLLTDLAREAGASAPDLLGRQLHLIYTGTAVQARTEREGRSSAAARAAAATLLDAALR